MRISDHSIEEVRQATDIVEVASEFTALRRQGSRFTGLCPYPDHQEKTPSFSVSPDRGFYYCFGCSRGGDAIKLVMDLRSLPFTEAVAYLAERSNVELQYEGTDSEAARERIQRRREIHKALAAAAVYYHKYLLKSKNPAAENARKYLKGRGFNRSTIEEFRLGFAPRRGESGFLGAVRRLGVGRSVLDAAGLLTSRGGERFAGRVTFPISDRRGRIVGFGARAMGDDGPKYLNSPETEVFNKRELLYGFPQVVDAIRKERAALVVEGYTDVLMLYQSGIKNTVATLGTAITPAHLRILSGYADRIYLLFDPDAAGEKATERAAASAADLKLDLRVLRLPQDPADWLLEHPAEEFVDLLSGAVPVLEYTIRRKTDGLRDAGTAERSRAVPEMRALISRIDDPVFRGEALRIASETLGVAPDVLDAGGVRRTAQRAVRSERHPVSDPWEQAGRQVLAVMLARPHIVARLLDEYVVATGTSGSFRLCAGDFRTEEQARIFRMLAERPGQDLDGLLSDERVRPFMDQLVALSAEAEKLLEEDLYASEGAIREAWLRLGILSRERRKRESEDLDLKERLHAEIRDLKEALRTVSIEP